MTCQKCVKKVENALQGVDGVKSVSVDLSSGKVLVDSSLGSERIKALIESTGKRAVLKGMGGKTGSHLGAAVSIMEYGSASVRGLIRFVQTDTDQLVVDGTIDGLAPGKHALCVHECGDVSEGCNSCGDVYGSMGINNLTATKGEMGDIEVGLDGRAEFRFTNSRLKVWELIGRSMIIHQASTEILKAQRGPDNRITCGIIARSAGLFQNAKKICACDGVTQWDERNVPVAGKGRQANL
ncbi:copper chaperone for superoxide dismutase-like isoform X2 [Mya arenaria]|nr:copper chaperone for superoxide dismutase-like isoform X2 [Mya arenaria]